MPKKKSGHVETFSERIDRQNFERAFQDFVFEKVMEGVLELGGKTRDLSSLLTDKDKFWKIVQAIVEKSKPKSQRSALPIWKTIRLGTIQSGKALYAALISAGYPIGSSLKKYLEGTELTISAKEVEVDLIKIRAAQLQGGAYADFSLPAVYTRAIKFGFALCTPEMAVQLRLQHPRSSKYATDYYYHIGMEPVYQDGNPLVFTLGNLVLSPEDNLSFSVANYFHPWTELVFVLPRK